MDVALGMEHAGNLAAGSAFELTPRYATPRKRAPRRRLPAALVASREIAHGSRLWVAVKRPMQSIGHPSVLRPRLTWWVPLSASVAARPLTARPASLTARPASPTSPTGPQLLPLLLGLLSGLVCQLLLALPLQNIRKHSV